MECPVNGGSGQYSYSKNSKFQRKAIEASKELIKKGVVENLDMNIFASSKTFRIADLGCAAGPNTFFAVQNIIDSVELKYKSYEKNLDNQLLNFHVFFNDNVSNDFNQLFASLPLEKRYFAAGVPGSFYGRLFPNESLHFVHSSYSMQILSRIPEEVLDKNSPAWNKGRIHYSGSSNDKVTNAYRAQHAKDMEIFLKARAQELVQGGLMAFIVPSCPEGISYSESFMYKTCEMFGSCFIDLANKGRINLEKVDSFNLPIYFPTVEEIEAEVKQSRCFDIEIMEIVPQETPKPKVIATTMRSGMGAFLGDHFGVEISDELFDLVSKKFEENSQVFESGNSASLFVLLKRL